MLKRKTPLRRTGNLKRGSRIRRIKPERAKERREYNARKADHLAAHPFDQIKIAMSGFDEDRVIESARLRGGNSGIYYEGVFIPRSNQIHHRNRCRGTRLNDERWWMATTLESHTHVETNMGWAREHGFLLPNQADADGRWGDGFQALTTPLFMKARAGL